MSDCEQAGYSHKKGRLYCRKFNWQEARDRHEAGESYRSIARSLGVHENSVRMACNAEFRAKMDASSRAWVMSGVCPDCGKPGTTRHKKGADRRCRECASAAARTTVVVLDGVLTAMRCVDCKKWKGQADYAASKWTIKRTNNRMCRECDTARRRAHRQANAEASRAYDREYRRHKRQASAS